MKTKTCSKCGRTKKLTEFYKRNDTHIGYRGTCKLCDSKRKRRTNRQLYKRKKEEPEEEVFVPKLQRWHGNDICSTCPLLEDCRRRVMEPKHFDPYCWVSSPYYSYYEKEVLHDKNTAL